MIYIDLDDVIADTWKLVLRLANSTFNIKKEKNDLISFNLAESLSLNKEQYKSFMSRFHLEENILSIPINRDFLKFNQLVEKEGIKMMLVTGRPLESRPATIKWIQKYSLSFEDILFVDKYNRYPQTKMTTLEELKKIPFKIGIEDSYTTSMRFSQYLSIPFFVYRQPWNKKYEMNTMEDSKISFFDSFYELSKFI